MALLDLIERFKFHRAEHFGWCFEFYIQCFHALLSSLDGALSVILGTFMSTRRLLCTVECTDGAGLWRQLVHLLLVASSVSIQIRKGFRTHRVRQLELASSGRNNQLGNLFGPKNGEVAALIARDKCLNYLNRGGRA